MITICALLAALPQVDERQRTIEHLINVDRGLFYETMDRFGLSRIETPSAINKAHQIVVRSEMKTVLDRFLVGNKTDKFTPRQFRVQYAAMTKPKAGPSTMPTFTYGAVEKNVRRFFGETDVKFTTGNPEWLVMATGLKAKKACISCHTSSKEGDLLGYLFYAAGPKL